MDNYKLGFVEQKFAELIWQNEPISSGELVKLCLKELEWKKSTTYTVLKKLCEKGIFQNDNRKNQPYCCDTHVEQFNHYNIHFLHLPVSINHFSDFFNLLF